MIDVEDLIALVKNYNPHCNAGLIRAAYDYGMQAHAGQTRHSGEPYFTHPIAVAAILTEMQLDDATIITALLHDTVEDTGSTKSEIADLFGAEIADLVDGVTKLTNLELSSTQSKQAENFRKLFMAMSRDLRVILVKLADRLHNMRTIRSMRPEKQVKKARETMDIYAPLAGRMGMQWMREELEDLAFKVMNHEARNSIIRRFVNLQRDGGDIIGKITADIRIELEKAGIEADVFGRAKKPFSVWRKMQEKQLAFSRLSDIYGFRIITRSESDCYRALGVIHQRWRAVPGRFKDYISQPKSNGYRSIHTTVSGRDGKRVEVQIRTRQMHEVNEAGVAAHWAYREGVLAKNPFAIDPAEWIASLTDRLDGEDHNDFLEHVKLEMYQDQVFCFTPKGEVIALPKGGTPLDFAFAIHTRLGNSCVGAKVDGIRVPLWTRLKNGQSVEIIAASGQKPQSTWLDIVVTGRAKSAIRRSLREADRDGFIRLGRELVRVSFEHLGHKVSDAALRTAARQMGMADADDLLARIGSAENSAKEVLELLYPEAGDHHDEIDMRRPFAGLEADANFKRAPCCNPLPGERILGITYRGSGVVIHAIDCPVLAEYEDNLDRWVDLRWREGRHPPAYNTVLNMTIRHDPGVLGRICGLIGAQGANISNLEFIDRKPDFYRIEVEVELRDYEHLHKLLTALEADGDVAQVARVRDPALKP
ncbi:bifunctional (p)ppGpp synthetase/guanosine-3',5'-bis(diphosphate) 3'-pyrophosphohydrolase [Paracoccus sp. (in: a-proteobacteria)]|uniref:RelA/SpoT family protein n=1 Tax=Paracoccus sp. TaxID=267 RepID=UPI0026E02FB2|nr:bifunctional (p)ppGpp synthetase/guanosine-3',5'-bis(diphosphate) 3'-pyrophosphohydrolase [Paracoccus sp. (in: a-proteobacteria)]MDO5646935.1 bifunctional (p)ppGpp synthetase/guanosine-3',5'-bis(diphosphate) 3'-pyrophosphohydrolase [Paracoccus sp. (in: a-proteobacteria)]